MLSNDTVISVIVPVYNVERYLEQCLGSICAQTYRNLEIVLVDDGSTDQSGAICDDWIKKDARIRVFHKPNGGLMSAWKYGVQRATGVCVGFVDSDDWIEPDMYAELLRHMVESDCDIVTSGFIRTTDEGEILDREDIFLGAGKYDADEIRTKIFPVLFSAGDYSRRGLSPNRVTKLFRMDVIRQAMSHCDESVTIGEDLLTVFSAFLHARSIYILDDFFPYRYRTNPNSMINRFNREKYDKVSCLRHCLLTVNQLHDYDFTLQINTDYVKLMLMQMEHEILFSGQSFGQLRWSLATLWDNHELQDAIKHAEVEHLPGKYKLYLELMRKRLWPIVIALRKLKR